MKTLVVLGVLATAVVAVSLAVAEEVDVKAPAAPATAVKFNHAKHPEKVVTKETCSDCHGKELTGVLAKPAQNGHQPCMSSGCHVDDFLSSSAAAKKKDAEAYAKAAAFCLGCHSSEKGEPPKSYTKAVADNVYKNNSTTEFHVELDHFVHVGFKSVKCRDCHVVQGKDNLLQADSPGHRECSQCHTGKTDAHAMGKCAGCHTSPGTGEYFTESRKGSDTRACGTEAHKKLAKKRKKPLDQVPCFKHETKEHRYWSKNPKSKSNWEQGEALQCGHCHFMFADKKTWKSLKGKYESIKQIKASPIMDTAKGEAHERCGEVRACHGSDFSGDTCTKCHESNSVGTGSLYD